MIQGTPENSDLFLGHFKEKTFNPSFSRKRRGILSHSSGRFEVVTRLSRTSAFFSKCYLSPPMKVKKFFNSYFTTTPAGVSMTSSRLCFNSSLCSRNHPFSSTPIPSNRLHPMTKRGRRRQITQALAPYPRWRPSSERFSTSQPHNSRRKNRSRRPFMLGVLNIEL